MGVEIEKKFLVIGDEWRKASEGTLYRQGYLKSGQGSTVRVRVAGEKGYLTIKGAGAGAVRREYELSLIHI